MSVFELGHCDQVTRGGSRNVFEFLALNHRQSAQSLGAAFPRVGDVGIGLDPAGEDTHQRDTAGVGVGDRLEDIGGEGAVGGRRELLLLAVHHGLGGPPIGRRDEIHEGVHDRLDCEVLASRGREDREDRSRGDSLFESADEGLGIELTGFEVGLHERFILLGHHFHQRLTGRADLIGEIAGNGNLGGGAALVGFPGKGLAGDQVDDTFEPRLFADGDLNRGDFAAELLLQ